MNNLTTHVKELTINNAIGFITVDFVLWRFNYRRFCVGKLRNYPGGIQGFTYTEHLGTIYISQNGLKKIFADIENSTLLLKLTVDGSKSRHWIKIVFIFQL